MTPPFARLLLATEHTEFDAGAETLALAMARRCGLPLVAVLPVVSNPEFEVAAPQRAIQADAEALLRSDALQEMASRSRSGSRSWCAAGPRWTSRSSTKRAERHSGSDRDPATRHARIPGQSAGWRDGQQGGRASAMQRAHRAAQGADVLRGVCGGRSIRKRPATRHWRLAAGIAVDCGLPLRVVCVVSTDAFAAPAERVLARRAEGARNLSERRRRVAGRPGAGSVDAWPPRPAGPACW